MGSFIDAYQHELDSLRRMGHDFAQTHPKIARRLRISGDTVDDPHVERLLEGVAFLTGRVQQRLDDAFPELTETLLDILYPHYLSPLPSGCIVQLQAMNDARSALTVHQGAPLETRAPDGTVCRFRTANALQVWPICAHSTELMEPPFSTPAHPVTHQARSCLTVRLTLDDPDRSFAELAPAQLRFYVDAAPQQAAALIELVCGHALGGLVCAGQHDDRAVFIPADRFRPVGFHPEDALYPWSERAFSGFRLLTEYFTLPEKFQFFDVVGLDARTLVEKGNTLTLHIFSAAPPSKTVKAIRPDTLCLNCVPIVNLSKATCRPIHLTHWQTSYPVIADHHVSRPAEIWQIDKVQELATDGTARAWQPLFQSRAHYENDDAVAGHYTLSRRPSLFGNEVETFLAPVNLKWEGTEAQDRILSVDATVSDGDLPSRLPFGGGSPVFTPAQGLGTVRAITCLTAPTAGLRQAQLDRNAWALITHLTLGRLSLTGGTDAAQALQDFMTLYDMRRSLQSQASIKGLISVESRPTTMRLSDAMRTGICRGVEVVLTFDATSWHEHGLFTLACILDRFMSLHVTVNAFIRTTVYLNDQVDPVIRFPPRSGHHAIL